MTAPVLVGFVLTVLGVAGTLLFDRRGLPAVSLASKVLASLGFIVVALGGGALATLYGRWILAALVASLVGDVFLGLRGQRAFLAGLGAFLAAHALYIAAFVVRGIAPLWTLVAFALLTVPRWYILRRLLPAAKGMSVPVQIYASVLTLMLAAAVGTAVADWTLLIPAGALAFYISDLFVARQRFLQPGFENRAIGLPLYYLGQLLLASSVIWYGLPKLGR